MPIIEVSLSPGRSPELLAELARELTATTCETLDIDASTVKLLIYEVPDTHWANGGVTLEEKRRADPAPGAS